MPLTLSRSLIVVLVPGIVAVAPWLLLIAIHADGVNHLYQTYQVPGNALLFALVVVVGSVIEGFGSYSEVRWDKERETAYRVKENWHQYLAQTPSSEPVGYRYIARTVTTMYFELCMALAGPSMLVGIAALLVFSDWYLRIWVGPVLVLSAIAIYCFFQSQAHDSHAVLCMIRKQLAERLAKVDVNDK